MKLAQVLLSVFAALSWACIRAECRSIDELSSMDSSSINRDIELPQPTAARAEAPAGADDAIPAEPMPEELAFLVRPEADPDPEAPGFDPLKISYSKSSAGSWGIPYLNEIKKEAQAQGVDVKLVLAIIQKESGFNPRAHNKTGATGLMQVLPDTARWLGLRSAKTLYTPEVNIKYGVKYLKYLLERFNAAGYASLSAADMARADIIKVVAAYNAGPGNVEKYDGVPPFKETKYYVLKVTEYFKQYEELISEKF